MPKAEVIKILGKPNSKHAWGGEIWTYDNLGLTVYFDESEGLSVIELKPADEKAVLEIKALYQAVNQLVTDIK